MSREAANDGQPHGDEVSLLGGNVAHAKASFVNGCSLARLHEGNEIAKLARLIPVLVPSPWRMFR
jgi:hypothetical protein